MTPTDRTETQNGHGAFPRRGRSASDPREALQRAMERLLALGQARARGRTVRVEGRSIHYLESGTGPPVVLVHGAGGGGANWYRLIGRLSAGYRVLAPDLPGFGFSEAIALDTPLGEAGARFLNAWLDAVGLDRVSLVATSFGGLMAMRLAQRMPERADRLVVMDSVGLGRELPAAVCLATLPGIGTLAVRPSRMGVRRLFRWLLTSDRSALEGHEDALVDYLWHSARAGDPAAFARALSLFGDLRGQREVLADEELRSIRTPTLVIWGARDQFLPVSHAERAAARIPGARLHIVPGAGHSPNWEAPEAVLGTVAPFLEGR